MTWGHGLFCLLLSGVLDFGLSLAKPLLCLRCYICKILSITFSTWEGFSSNWFANELAGKIHKWFLPHTSSSKRPLLPDSPRGPSTAATVITCSSPLGLREPLHDTHCHLKSSVHMHVFLLVNFMRAKTSYFKPPATLPGTL